MTDPLFALVAELAQAHAEPAAPPMVAWLKAEAAAIRFLEAAEASGAPVGNWLRRVRVYQLRTQGIRPGVIAMRLSISRVQVHRDYRQELERRRSAA